MRSSVACARCRRSKIKCINNGVNTTCVPCHQSNRECTYPPPLASVVSEKKRSEHPSGIRPEGEGETKRPRKREPDAGGKQIHRIGEDPLETPPITLKLWRQIYSLFTLHYSTDLPFLHEKVFFNRIAKMQASGERSRETQLFLLGLLSLTARFIPELVAYPYPSDRSRNPRLKPGNPLYASEFYAHALETRLDHATQATASLDIIHANLMLAFHNWSMCRGLRSWTELGNATRLAHAMGLSSEEEIAYIGKPSSVSLEEAERLGVKQGKPNPSAKVDSQTFVTREIKRRTMWSCFILDRYLSSGRRRPQMCSEMHIQLPCSEEDFRFGTNVKTEFLYPDAEAPQEGESLGNEQFAHVDSNSILSIYIKLVDIWGRFSKWSCAGGRRQEKYIPPWDERTVFFKLRKQLDDFQASLPPKLIFNSSNLAAHVGGPTMSTYTAIHSLFSLCQIVLHREYIPFIPLRCDRPVGPLDEPTFPKEQFTAPHGFWEESAKTIFKAARNIMEIVQANSQLGYFIESPQVGFAIWTAAFVGVYSLHFPHMDTSGYMNGMESNFDFGGNEEAVKGAAGLAVRTLAQMGPKMKMAYGWSRTVKRMHEYFAGIIKDYARNCLTPLSQRNNSESSGGAANLSLREGGRGGGLEEYKLLENELKEFGKIEEDENSTPTASERTASIASTSGLTITPNIKIETMQGVERVAAVGSGSEGAWAAVNNNASSTVDDFSRPLSYPIYGTPQASTNTAQDAAYYHQQQQSPPKGPASNPPSLITASPNPVDLNPSYNQPELTHIAPSEPYHHSLQQLAGYPSSTQHPIRLHHVTETPAWISDSYLPGHGFFEPSKQLDRVILGGSQVAGFSDGLPFAMWAPEGDETFLETEFMQALWGKDACVC